jgi:RNA polymerase subunit RPABC4/transcription elongation factor Spt4
MKPTEIAKKAGAENGWMYCKYCYQNVRYIVNEWDGMIKCKPEESS